MKRIRSGGDEIRAFANALTPIVGDEMPVGLPGDLSDLLGTMTGGLSLLRSLESTTTFEDAGELVLALEYFIVTDLPPILRDLRPSIRRVARKVYDLYEIRDKAMTGKQTKPPAAGVTKTNALLRSRRKFIDEFTQRLDNAERDEKKAKQPGSKRSSPAIKRSTPPSKGSRGRGKE